MPARTPLGQTAQVNQANTNELNNTTSQGICAGCGAVHRKGYGNYVDLLLTEGYAPFCSTACITAFVKSEAGKARLQYVSLSECGGDGFLRPCQHCLRLTQINVGETTICVHPGGKVTEEPAKPEFQEEYQEGMNVLLLDAGYGPYDGGAAFCEADCLVNSFTADHPDWDAKRR